MCSCTDAPRDPAAVRVLGLDSAERTGFALIERAGGRERLVRYGVLRIQGAGDVERAVNELALESPDLVAIEAPFVRANAATGLTLATLLGRWLQAWERLGTPTTTVLASGWRPVILAGLCDRRSDRATCKRAARTWAKASFGVELDEDEADATGIAAWALRRRGSPSATAGGAL